MDLINRQAAIDALCKAGCGSKYCGISCDDVKAIEDLPTAQPEHIADDERKIADLHKMVNCLLSQLEQRWIPCSERLPEEYGEYICTMENGQVQECGFVPENQRGVVDGWSTCEADGYKFLGYVDVLAWMPLPEPYGGEQDG